MPRTALRRTLPALLALALAVAACGGGGDEEEAATTTTTRRPTTTTTTTIQEITSALTGLPVSQEVHDRPIVAVKYDNVDGRSTPQAGVNQADVVYEITVEGQVTRFLALFQSEDATNVGPVRSARGSEVGLLEELSSPLFTWHGANAVLSQQVRNSAVIPRSIDDIPQLFYRDRSRSAPYNSFVQGTAEIRATAPDDATAPGESILTFGDAGQVPSASAVPVSSVTVTFPPAFGGSSRSGAPVRFDWDPATSRWLRFQNGRPHLDAAGEQIAVENVIVRFTEATDSGTRDSAGSLVPTAVVTGEGEAWIFSAGKVATGTWSKPDGTTRTTYRDVAGAEVALTPGATWIAMPYGPGASAFG